MRSVAIRSAVLINGLAAMLLLAWGGSLRAQYYFGRNKVQYANFDWQVLTAEHLSIYYYSSEAEIAQLALHYGEEFYAELESRFNYTLSRPIPVVIYSNPIHFQQTNILTVLIPENVGGFFEFIKERVAVPFNGSLDDFLHALKHELVHVFFYGKITNAANEVGAWDLPDFPLWFVEGLAESWSRGWDSQAEMILRDAILNDYLFPLNSYELYESGFLLYKEGQAFLRWFEQRYGSDRIRELLSEYWRYDTFEKALAAITGREFSNLESEWRQALRQALAAPLSRASLLTAQTECLTKVGANSHPATFRDSTGQAQIVYLHNQMGYTDIRLWQAQEKRARTILKGERQAANESLHFLQSGLSVNSRGELVYVTKSGARDILRIVTMDSRRELNSLEVESITTIRNPQWAADNQRIVFSAQDESGQSDLYLWLLSDSQVIRLTDDYYSDTDPCFDPTGRYLAFVSDRNQPPPLQGKGLFIFDLEQARIFQVVGPAYGCSCPMWVGRSEPCIRFLATRDGVANLWEATLPEHFEDGAVVSVRQLTNFFTGIRTASPLTPDTVICSAIQKYNFQLYRCVLGAAKWTGADTLKTVSRTPGWTFSPAKEHPKLRQQPYKLKYSLDFAQTNVVQDPIFGFVGGAQVGISDLLGNRYYHFLVANTAQATGEILDHFNYAMTLVDLSRRCNRAIGWFHFANDYYSPYEGFYYERSQGLRAALNYPVDVFRRLEFSASLWQAYRDYYFGKIQRAFLVSNYVSWVWDNTVWLPTGPIDGRCMRLTIGPTFDFLKAKFYNYTILGDLRLYFRLFGSVTWAQRYMAWFNEGTDIYRFYIGGSWGLRGYGMNEIYGCKYFMINQELRFPFAHSLVLRFGLSDIRLAPIRAALFCDVGNAWDEEYPGAIGSVGVGLRAALLGSLVLRLDTGRRTDFHSFSKHQFWQFFFGYDF